MIYAIVLISASLILYSLPIWCEHFTHQLKKGWSAPLLWLCFVSLLVLGIFSIKGTGFITGTPLAKIFWTAVN